jgi:hypothetical protein
MVRASYVRCDKHGETVSRGEGRKQRREKTEKRREKRYQQVGEKREERSFNTNSSFLLLGTDASRTRLLYGAAAVSASVVKYGTTTELVARCCKVITLNLASCMSAAGVGREFVWSLEVGKIFI